MMKRFAITLVVFLCVLVSCDQSERDITDPRLPRYTEHGANVAGCIINDKAWFDPCYFGFFQGRTTCDGLVVAYDTLLNYSELRFSGGHFTAGFEELQAVTLIFRLPGKRLTNFNTLLTLIGSDFPVDGASVYADLMTQGESILECAEGDYTQTGKIFFRSHGTNHLAFAGTFGFSTNSDCARYDVLHGRFDYDVAAVNFISLN